MKPYMTKERNLRFIIFLTSIQYVSFSGIRMKMWVILIWVLTISSEFFIPTSPVQLLPSRWIDLMTRCVGTCFYFPEGDPKTVVGTINHACRNFPYGPKGRYKLEGLPHLDNAKANRNPCRYAVWLQPYYPKCDTFDRQPLNDRLCQYFNTTEYPELYLITIGQNYPIDGCQTLTNRNPAFKIEDYKREMDKDPKHRGRCNPWDENVAFGFSDNKVRNMSADGAERDKIFYVCGNEGLTAYPYNTGVPVVDFSQGDNPVPPAHATRITLSHPYADSAPGVLWYRIVKPEGERSIICSIVLATRGKYQYRTSKWKVDIAGGKEVIYHDILPGTLKPEYIDFKSKGVNDDFGRWFIKVGTAKIKRYYYPTRMIETLPETMQEQFRNERIYTHRITKVKIDDIVVSKDPVTLDKVVHNNPLVKYTEKDFDPVYNSDILQKINAIYASCRDDMVLCYNFPWEDGCQSREKCLMLVVIEEMFNFQRLHIDMLTHPNPPNPVVQPYSYGWMGFAFSKDSMMGGESVFTCSFKGRADACRSKLKRGARNKNDTENECSRIYISINLEHPYEKGLEKNNFYAGDYYNPLYGEYQQLIENPNVDFAEVPSESQPRVLCSFDIKTDDYNNISLFPKRPKEILQYDLLNEEYYVLLATGRSVVGEWQISYHGKNHRASGSSLKFSRELYKKKVKHTHRHSH